MLVFQNKTGLGTQYLPNIREYIILEEVSKSIENMPKIFQYLIRMEIKKLIREWCYGYNFENDIFEKCELDSEFDIYVRHTNCSKIFFRTNDDCLTIMFVQPVNPEPPNDDPHADGGAGIMTPDLIVICCTHLVLAAGIIMSTKRSCGGIEIAVDTDHQELAPNAYNPFVNALRPSAANNHLRAALKPIPNLFWHDNALEAFKITHDNERKLPDWALWLILINKEGADVSHFIRSGYAQAGRSVGHIRMFNQKATGWDWAELDSVAAHMAAQQTAASVWVKNADHAKHDEWFEACYPDNTFACKVTSKDVITQEMCQFINLVNGLSAFWEMLCHVDVGNDAESRITSTEIFSEHAAIDLFSSENSDFSRLKTH